MKELDNILLTASRELGIHLGKREIVLFKEYYRELLLWNKKMSLVSIKFPLDIPIKHFIDSLTVLPFIHDKKRNLLDIGSGAGFPGIPVKIVMGSLNVSLLDSSRKKTSFLKNIIRKLNLENTRVINMRVEQFMKEATQQGGFDVVISRASFKLPQFIETCAGFLSHQGTLIAMKGKNIDAEMKEAAKVCEKAGLYLTDCHDIQLPISGDPRKILLFEKHSR